MLVAVGDLSVTVGRVRRLGVLAATIAVLSIVACTDDGEPVERSEPPPTTSSAPVSTTAAVPSTSTTVIPAPPDAGVDTDAEGEGEDEVPEVSEGVVFDGGIAYGEALVGGAEGSTSRPLLLDAYRPSATPAGRRLPAVVVIHGGGFERRTRRDAPIAAICDRFAQEGFVALSIDYRLRGEEPVTSARVAPLAQGLEPGSFFHAVVAATDDAIAALDFVERHADDLGIDPTRIAVVGSSAGAITADHVAYAAPAHGIDVVDVRFVGSLWGGILLGPPAGTDGPGANQLTTDSPPLWSIHGDEDATVPFQLADQLVARAAEVGVPHEFYRVAAGTHGYGGTGFFTTDLGDGDTPLDRLVHFARFHTR